MDESEAERRVTAGPLVGNLGSATVTKETPATELIRAYRERGGSLEVLACELGVSHWTVYRWARGLTEPQGLHWRELQRVAGEGDTHG